MLSLMLFDLQVFPNASKTQTTPQNVILQEFIGSPPEPESPPDLAMQTPQQLLRNFKSTSLTPLLQGCQLQVRL